MQQKELEKYLWGAATLLRGTIDAGDYKQFIFPLLFFKRICDVYDEEYERALKESSNDKEYAGFAEHHHFQIPKKSHWNEVRDKTVNVGITLQNALSAIEKSNPEKLQGIFGDASWTNKEKLSDEVLIDLIEHFSKQKLNLKNISDDKLGNAYEYLIKKFADDSGHTAAEFYTNRTVVKLMTMIMDPKPGESIYDPTCGSGGLLLNCSLKLKEDKKEYRNVKLYGQEVNLITSAIARMNMFIHGVEDFKIFRGDTLDNPGFIKNDKLQKFNIILANPPYSIKSWNQKAFINDAYGRNIWGTPPKKCADYAFQQHIQKSLDSKNGRSITLWPHGILFRGSESDIRKEMVKDDQVECVIGLGPNLFYSSPMESCLLITRTNKSKARKEKILIINAIKEIKQEQNLAFLQTHNLNRIFDTYTKFSDEEGFSKVVSIKEVLKNNGSLNIAQYVSNVSTLKKDDSFNNIYNNYKVRSFEFKESIKRLFETIN